MNLTVCPRLGIDGALNTSSGIKRLWVTLCRDTALGQLPRRLEVLGRHANHHRLFFLGIEILDNAFIHQILPAVRDRLVRNNGLARILVDRGLCGLVAVHELTNMLLLESEPLIVIDDEKRTTDSTRIGEDAELALTDIPNDGHLGHNVTVPTQLLDGRTQTRRVPMDSLPDAIDKDFGTLGEVGREILQALHAPLF
jgi:hypothetical protein